MAQQARGQIVVDDCGSVLVATLDGGPHGLFGVQIANQLDALVERADKDPNVRAVVFTGARDGRFVSHADVFWLQTEGAAAPELPRRATSAVLRVARGVDRARALDSMVQKTPMRAVAQIDRLHNTFLRMNGSGVVFVAALNGSALGLGAEFAWACDLRIMSDDEQYFIGQPEVLLGIMPGGGGSQRLPRLIGTHKALVACLEGRPFSPAQALANGAVDELVPTEHVVSRAVEVAEYLGRRHKASIRAIKRSIYLGGSMTLPEGLHLERTEFLGLDQAAHGQQLMLQYLDDTESVGELPLYHGDTFENALESGRVPAIGRKSAGVTR